MSICSIAISNLKKIKKKNILLGKEVKAYLLLAENNSGSRSEQIERLIKIFKLRKELKLEINEAIPIEFKFVVENAKNPYAEALKEGGITNVAEIIKMEVDLQKTLTEDREAYKNAGCNIWANALPEKVEDLNLTHKQIEIIKARIKLGEIPIVIPGRLAQINGLMQAIDKLKPKWVKDGEEHDVMDTSHWDYVDKLIDLMKDMVKAIADDTYSTKAQIDAFNKKGRPLVKNQATGLFDLFQTLLNLPERPYIFTTSTNKQTELRTRNKNLDDQLREMRYIRFENPELDMRGQNIGECLSLQNRFTDRVIKETDAKLKSLVPLDDSNSPMGTNSRIIELPISSIGWATGVYWTSGRWMISIFNDSGLADSKCGFRTSVRI